MGCSTCARGVARVQGVCDQLETNTKGWGLCFVSYIMLLLASVFNNICLISVVIATLSTMSHYQYVSVSVFVTGKMS